MAVEAVVSVVIQKVTDLLIQDAIIFDKVIDQVEDIRLALRQMRGFLTDAEERQKVDDNVREWVQKYLETVYVVEDMVETYVLGQCKRRQMAVLQNYGFFFFHNLKACQNLRGKMKDIEKQIIKLNKEKPEHVEDASLRCISLNTRENGFEYDDIDNDQLQDLSGNMSPGGSNFRETKQTTYVEEEDADFIGFKEYVKELRYQLTSNCGNIIPVVGPLGSGKTSLVRRVYNQKSIKEHFESRAWLNISEDRSLKDLLLRIWNQLNKKQKNRELTLLDEDKIKEKLFQFLQGHKYLIILDDARNQPDAWKQIVHDFPAIENGSKVVVITREKAITRDWNFEGNSRHLCLEPLDKDKSWELFLRKVCLGKDNRLAQNQVLRGEIVKKCRGLPLDIVLLGGLLYTKNVSYGEWTRLFNQANWHSSEIWLLSYNDLPVHYKLCLLYLGLFPKEFDIPVRRILRLWLAEGFLQRSAGFSEDLAEECFSYLVKRNLIKITKFRSDGGPKNCCLPGFLREHLSPMAQEISLFHIHDKTAEQPELRVHRIVEYADIKDYARDVKNLRSYLSFNFPRYDAPAKEVGNFLRKVIGNKGFALLRVLDLEGVYKPTLPPTLKHLFQLRYLGLRWTFLDVLPESVGDLPYLETLDLKRTYINSLPSSVWKLKHLRQLNLPDVRLDTRMQQPGSQLLTLWGLIINKDYDLKNGLSQLENLRELGITCQFEQCDQENGVSQYEEVMHWITNLTCLQSLSLISKDKMGRPSDITLMSLSELGNLSHLEVLGKLNHRINNNNNNPLVSRYNRVCFPRINSHQTSKSSHCQ